MTNTTETVQVQDCKLGDILALAQGLFKICVFYRSADRYVIGKDFVDSNGKCHPFGVCFYPGTELVERVVA
jgi:hypothetical protein